MDALIAGSGTWVSWNSDAHHHEASEAQTRELIAALFESPLVRGIDTSNNYGFGEAERRIGRALKDAGGIPAGFRIQTKADRDSSTGEFSGRRIRASLDESRKNLGLEELPLVYLHDPENMAWDDAFAADGPVATLVRARERGVIGKLGVAGGPSALMARYLRTGVFEMLITHNRFTLVDRSADGLLSLAHGLAIEVSNASPYGGGFLTRWPPPTTRYAYGEAAPSIHSAGRRAALVCARHGVDLAAAALAFSMADHRIDQTIIGMQTVSDLHSTCALAQCDVPDEALRELIDLRLDPLDWQDPPDSDRFFRYSD